VRPRPQHERRDAQSREKNGGVVQVCLLGNYIKTMPQNPEREAALKPLQEKLRRPPRRAEG
jgi:membrane dipeptidase